MGTGSAPGAVTLDDGGTDGRTQEGPRGGGPDLAGEVSDAATDTASGGDLTTAHGETNGRNVTNEANFYGDVSTSESKKIVEVTAKSVVGPGLDNLRTKPILAVGWGEDEAVDDSTSAVLRPESGTAPGTPLTPALSPVSGQWSVVSGQLTLWIPVADRKLASPLKGGSATFASGRYIMTSMDVWTIAMT